MGPTEHLTSAVFKVEHRPLLAAWSQVPVGTLPCRRRTYAEVLGVAGSADNNLGSSNPAYRAALSALRPHSRHWRGCRFQTLISASSIQSSPIARHGILGDAHIRLRFRASSDTPSHAGPSSRSLQLANPDPHPKSQLSPLNHHGSIGGSGGSVTYRRCQTLAIAPSIVNCGDSSVCQGRRSRRSRLLPSSCAEVRSLAQFVGRTGSRLAKC